MNPDATGMALMREHELACERETTAARPDIAAVLRDLSDCIIESVQRLDQLGDLDHADQAIMTQLVLGVRSSHVFVDLALTGQYESAMALARTVIEDGVAGAYLAENREEASRWLLGDAHPSYGKMAAAVIKAHTERAEQTTRGERAEWEQVDDTLRQLRPILDNFSHANPARFTFVRKPAGYVLYPFYDEAVLELVTYFGILGLNQILFAAGRLLRFYGRSSPTCDNGDLDTRMNALLDSITKSSAQALGEPQV